MCCRQNENLKTQRLPLQEGQKFKCIPRNQTTTTSQVSTIPSRFPFDYDKWHKTSLHCSLYLKRKEYKLIVHQITWYTLCKTGIVVDF